MAKYRKKPTVVDAEQWFVSSNPETWHPAVTWLEERGCYAVKTIHGEYASLTDGDWIITEPDGVHAYPCKPDIFSATYEEKSMHQEHLAEQLKRIENNFTYHPPKEGQQDRYVGIRSAAKDLALYIVSNTPPSREQSIALTQIEDAVMWANAAIARNE